ncbi:MAG: alpha/beta fold hydrolase [Stellaceae bacterium]
MTDYLDCGGHRLEVRKVSGVHRTEPTLIFLHEGLGSVALWKDFPDKVAAATGLPAVIYSRLGYGKSDRLTGDRAIDYMHVEALETLPELRHRLGLEDVILIGHSDGASIALIHAGAGRWPVRALILEAPHVFVEEVTVDSIAAAKTVFETSDMVARLKRYHDDPEGAFWGWNRIWLDPAFRRWNIEDVLSAVTAPILAIQGAEDEYGTLRQIDAIERGVGGRFERLVLSQCRHAPHRDHEAATLAAMAQFIAEVAR